MEKVKQSTIENFQAQLCEALPPSALPFLTQLHVSKLINDNERDLIQSHVLDQGKTIKALDILKNKLGGYQLIIIYLKNNRISPIAEKRDSSKADANFSSLEHTIFQASDKSHEKSKMLTEIEIFIYGVIDFYPSSYRVVESFDDDSEVIELVWVDLQLKEIAILQQILKAFLTNSRTRIAKSA